MVFEYYHSNINSYILYSVIETEKLNHSLFEGVENYDKTSLKSTETQEKVNLPDKQGIGW